MKITNKTVVITGGASGIGLELAKRLCGHNKVFICDIKKRSLFKVRKQYADIQAFECDITDDIQVANFVSFVAAKSAHVDILINNAAIGRYHELTHPDFTIAQILPEIEVNFIGQIRITTAFLPLLREKQQSTIITISAGLAIIPYNKACIYSAAKAALHSYVQSLRKQLENESIKVIEVFPPSIDTIMSKDQEKAMSITDFCNALFIALESGKEELFIGDMKDVMAMYWDDPKLAYHNIQQMGETKKDTLSTLRKLLKQK